MIHQVYLVAAHGVALFIPVETCLKPDSSQPRGATTFESLDFCEVCRFSSQNEQSECTIKFTFGKREELQSIFDCWI